MWVAFPHTRSLLVVDATLWRQMESCLAASVAIGLERALITAESWGADGQQLRTPRNVMLPASPFSCPLPRSCFIPSAEWTSALQFSEPPVHDLACRPVGSHVLDAMQSVESAQTARGLACYLRPNAYISRRTSGARTCLVLLRSRRRMGRWTSLHGCPLSLGS